MKSKDRLLCIAGIIIAVCCIILTIDMMTIDHRVKKIESSYVTQEQLDTTLIEVFD